MKLYTSISSSKLSITETTESWAVLNICEYVFSVSSIFVCPKSLATNVTLAPLLIKRDVHKTQEREAYAKKKLILYTVMNCKLSTNYGLVVNRKFSN